MNLWYKKSLIFILAGISYCAGFFFSNPARFGFCSGTQSSSYICRVLGAINIGWSLIALGQVLAVLAITLLFANAATFHKWLKFSVFYIPIATALTFWMYPTYTPLGALVPLSQGVYLFGNLFALITLGIVLWNFFAARRATAVKV